LSFLQINKPKQKDNILAKKNNNNSLSRINNQNTNSNNNFIHLQQTFGNQQVQQMIKSNVLQAKLKVSQPNDPYEREADQVADQVMRMPSPKESYVPIKNIDDKKIDRKCKSCEKEENEELKKIKINRKKKNDSSSLDSHISDGNGKDFNDVTSKQGSPLDTSTREFMESRFGYDFGNVRIHTGEKASKSAQSVNALAYTIGNNIVFEGRYLPKSKSGKKLLAHELTHVVQQEIGNLRIARAPQDEADTELPETQPSLSETTPDSESTTPSLPEVSDPLVPEQRPTVTPSGHAVAPLGVSPCPDPPARTIVVVGCNATSSVTPPAKETAVLPIPNPTRFGGESHLATFAKELAQCHADRIAKNEIDKRYRADVETAKKNAISLNKANMEAAVNAAVDTKAKKKAKDEANKMAKKKIADAEAAVSRQNVATVTAELATKFEDDLANYYDKIITVGFNRYRKTWLNRIQRSLDKARKQITNKKKAKPRVAKGEMAPVKTADEISAEVEAEMVPIRCEQKQWALNRFEWLKHGWAVKSREKVDFDTLGRWGKYFGKDFKPTYEIPEAARVDIPASLQEKDAKPMPGIAPEVASFLTQLAGNPATPAFTVANYGGHGLGVWFSKGFSVDLYLSSSNLDQRGFYPVPLAIQFLLTLDATAKAFGARWRVLYNDFRVADKVNKTTGLRNVGFVDWHGPLVLHMHLDLEIPKDNSMSPSPGTMPAP
jgi:hypothetical protein